MSSRSIILTILTVMFVCACSVSKKVANLAQNAVSARLQLSNDDEPMLPELDMMKTKARDTIRITGLNGEDLILMNAVKDDDGEMVAHDVIDAAYVTARFRNVAERHGKIDLEFQVVVPEAMQDTKWQLRFYPDMYILEDSVRLESVIITGKDYRKAQLRGYQRYEKFVQSIITDTTRFIRLHELEVFLERNLHDLYLLADAGNFRERSAGKHVTALKYHFVPKFSIWIINWLSHNCPSFLKLFLLLICRLLRQAEDYEFRRFYRCDTDIADQLAVVDILLAHCG